MKEYVNQLLDCLEIYQVLIRRGIFTSEFDKQVEKLNTEIDLLRSISHERDEKLLQYDYKSLKKDLARLFHSDRFNGNTALLENPDELLGKTFGVIDDIEKYKSKNPSNFTNNDSKETNYNNYNSTSYNSNPYSDPSYENTQAYGERRRKRQTQTQTQEDYEYKWENDPDEQPYYAEYNDESTNLQGWVFWIKEKFNFIVNGIPASNDEYDKLFTKYQNICETCNNQIDILNTLIEKLEEDIYFLKKQKLNDTRPERIESIYQRRLEKYYKIALKAASDKDNLNYQLNCREKDLNPQITRKYNHWLQHKDNYLAKYYELLNFYNYQRANFKNVDFKKMENELTELHKYITDNYMNPNQAYTDITDEVLTRDSIYQEISKKFDIASKSFDEADLNYENYCSTPEVHKKHIKESIERKYDKEIKKVKNILKNKAFRKKIYEFGLNTFARKQDALVGNYGEKFGQQTGRKK